LRDKTYPASRRWVVAAFAFLLLAASRGWAWAQDDGGMAASIETALNAHIAARPWVQTIRIQSHIDLDGKLDEAEWKLVAPATAFFQTEPFDGPPGTERTEVFVLYDEGGLYVGARMWESSGDVRKRLSRRDSFLFDSDWFYITLDTYHDHVSAVQFSVNPAGVKRDEVVGTGMPDASWDAVWDVATSTDAEGWTAEFRIPFSQLRFSARQEQVWGLQFSRRAIRKEEMTVFAHTPKSEKGGPARYGHLIGLQGIKPGRKLEVLPYAVTRAEYVQTNPADPFRDGSDVFAGTGLDMKYRLTSSLTLDATFNPDFGQVEVDPAVVNLSAFETSFDEKRPFFVEGSDIFRFNELRLFYSRRIGRSPQGSMPEDVAFSNRPDNSTILGAAKITGRTSSGWSVGLVEAVTAEETAPFVYDDGGRGEAIVEPRTNYLVARTEKLMRSGQTQVGGILTAVHRDLSDDALSALLRSSAYSGGLDFLHEFANRTWSISGYMAFSRINGSSSTILRAQHSSARYYQRPDADYLDVDSAVTMLDGYAARLVINKTAGLHWRGDANISAVSPGFEVNDLGFLTAADRIGSDVNLSYVENRPGRLFRNYRINLRNAGDWNFGGDVIAARSTLSFNYSLVNYWGGHFNWTHSFRAYDDRLTRGGPVARDLADNRLEVQLNSDGRKQVSTRFTVNHTWGESGGWNTQLSGNVSVRPAENWSISVGPRLNRQRTAAQYLGSEEDSSSLATFGRRYVFAPIRQTTFSLETRLNVNFSPELSFELFAQPFVSTGDYGQALQLKRPRAFEFDPYSGSIESEDFNTRSLRGNAVLRWEWRPGSTLFLVWQQRRFGSFDSGRFDFGRDTRAIFDTRPNNVFLVKMNYWLNL
jgi:hypothetical protein